MSKTIKIIDLLNKIANREEVPEKIKYYNRNLKGTDIMLCCKENIIVKLNCESIYLNDEVEIIEEQEEIDIQELKELLLDQLRERKYTNADIYMLGTQINALIKAVKQLDQKINDQ